MNRQSAIFALALIALAGIAGAQTKPAAVTRAKCDAACLTAAIGDFLAKTMNHRTGEILIAPDALVYFNTQAGKLDRNPFGRVKAIKSQQIFADPETGNVLLRTGVELQDGRIAYASSRLKIVGGTITQVETSFDDSSRVVASNVTALNPLMTQVVPPGQRMSRAEMKATIERYFQSLTTHTALAADFDDSCDRYHSGQRITNNARNTVETGAPPMTCYTSVLGNPPWGPATNIRIPVIDTEHGAVAGYTLLLYKDGSAPMYVSEVFKVLGGKIRLIDNIGLKDAGMKAVTFP